MPSPIVLAWILVSAFGLMLSLRLASDSRKGLAVLRKAGIANGRRQLARIWFAGELIFASAHLAYLVLGLKLLEQEVRLSPTALVLLYGNVAMMAVALLNLHVRRLLYDTRDSEPPIPKPEGMIE